MTPPKRVLMVYPEFLPTYWGMQYSLELMDRKALMPPLGLITIAAMSPSDWEFKLVDLNCEKLKDEDLAWADLVLLSAMLPQKETLIEVAQRCREAGKMTVVGGPYPTACPDECKPFIDVVVMNEGEVTWPLFLKDYLEGHWKPVYTSEEKPDVTQTPCPRFDLLNLNDYGVIPLQYSRGCPFQCEFCDIIVMYGRKPRTKTPAQFLKELDALYATGHRGTVFIVDDNFIGNKKNVMAFLPELKRWSDDHAKPFNFGTEASVNLADDKKLIQDMRAANMHWVFMGIETPSFESLNETHKHQNTVGISLLDRVKLIQETGLCVFGGFIIGFDNDTEDIFDRQIEFITDAAIPSAMIGPLVALPQTPLYERLKKEGRLSPDAEKDRTVASGYTNIETRLPRQKLLEGHIKILKNLYQPHAFFNRCLETFRRIPRPQGFREQWEYFQSILAIGAPGKVGKNGKFKIYSPWRQMAVLFRAFRAFSPEYRLAAFLFLLRTIRAFPENLPVALYFVFLGHHYFRFTFDKVIPDLTHRIQEDKQKLQKTLAA